MLFIGVCRLLGRLLSVACGIHRHAFNRCVSVACEIAVGSLWNVSVCFFIGVCRLLGTLLSVACGM